MGTAAGVIFDNASIEDPLPQLRHAVGRKHGKVQESKVERPSVLPAAFTQIRNVNLGSQPDMGIRLVKEVLKMSLPRILFQIDPLRTHSQSPLF